MQRTPFPGLFWTGNAIEILERFAYYGLYMGFGIYATKTVAEGGLGWSKGQLGVIQTVFLLLSYSVPLVSGILADRFGFKRLLMVSYFLYLPGFLLMTVADTFWVTAAVMVLIAVGAGVFKPLIAGTVRLTTDATNRTLGFGIFYLMVNVGAFFGPMTTGALRTVKWEYSFIASAVVTGLMIVMTWMLYKNPIEPSTDVEARKTVGQTLGEIFHYVVQPKMLVFILIFGVLIQIPFWSFFNIVPVFVDEHVRTDVLYVQLSSVLPDFFVNWFSTEPDAEGARRVAGETLSHTALYIIIFQMLVTRTSERMRSIPVVAAGILLMVLGCVGLFFSTGPNPWIMFLGVLLFAVGEMACMPRFEQYVISLLPPEKTGLGGGLLRIPIAIGAFSGVTITSLYGGFEDKGNPQSVWLVLGGMLALGFLLMLVYDRFLGEEV